MNLEQRMTDIEKAVMMAGLATKQVLNFDEACNYTGLSQSYLYKLTAGKKVPHYKPTGKLCYFNREELEMWLQNNRVSTQEEIADKAQSYCMKKGGAR